MKTSSRPFFVFQKSFIWGKSKWHAAYFQYISIVLNLAYNINKLFKTLDCWSHDMLSFDFLEKRLRIVSSPLFVYDFLRKMFFVLCSINWSNFIAWLPLLLEILINMCIAIVCQPGCNVVNLETLLIFLIKPFFYMTKMSRQIIKYLENEKNF